MNVIAWLARMNLLGMLLAIVVGFALGALLLNVAFRLVVGHMPLYLRALGTVVLTWIATVLVALILALVMPRSLSGLAGTAALFLIGAWAINYMLRTPTGLPVGFGKACLVQLVYMVIGFIVLVVLGLIMALLFGSALIGLH